MSLTIVGLGPGAPGDLTRQAWEVINGAGEVYLRTRVHPTVPYLPASVTYHSFDDLYESLTEFDQVYNTITERLLARAMEHDVVYCVPGDPTIAEGTVSRLRGVCGEKQIAVRIVHGISFVEPTLAALEVDAFDGLQLFDAIDIANVYHPPLNPDYPALIAQIYGQRLASDVKLSLMNQYPDEHPVTLIHAAGTDQEQIERLPLFEIDRRNVWHLTTLFVPPLETSPNVATSFEGFQQTIAQLRAPDGCPWDREQTHESLRPYVLEETYEVLDAIDKGEPDKLAEELGDLLLQVVLHSQIGVDEGEFTMADIVRHIDSKIKRRHPHVWGDVNVNGSSDQVRANWQEIKAAERASKGETEKSLLDGIPQALPALAQANQYDHRARRVGFDWASEEEVIAKVHEEIAEIQAATTPDERFMEIGDLLLASAVWARWLDINPEDALRAANRRFYNRFTYIEHKVHAQNRDWKDVGLEEMLTLWNEAKTATSLDNASEK
jgi:tetrapyrrole methylase family protein / MazG family protein